MTTRALIAELVEALEDVCAAWDRPTDPHAELELAIKHARRILSHARAAQSEEWQPIETAPKDGTKILLYFPDRGGWIILAYWDHRTWTNGDTWESQFTDQKPTHWRPLPSAPSK